MAENGIIPDKNYVLVSKLENFYGLKLRKEGAGASMRSLVEKKAADASKGHRTFGLAKKEEVVKRENPANKRVDEAKDESMSGNDIELIFDE